MLVEDINGDVEELYFYGLSTPFEDVKKFRKNEIFVIKEPSLVYEDLETNKAVIRVDSPIDIVYIDEADYEVLR